MFKQGFCFAPGYRIEEFLGRGQFGQVWRVEGPGGTSAAVKFIDLSESSSRKEYEGIRRIKQIRQANLMPITAIWQLDEHGKLIDDDFSSQPRFHRPGYARICGRPSNHVVHCTTGTRVVGRGDVAGRREPAVDHEIRERSRTAGIPSDELILYMQDAAKGLDFLNQPNHDLGDGPVAIQHCDVKPANIVTLGNSAVICDFGLAKILTRQQATATSAAGTPSLHGARSNRRQTRPNQRPVFVSNHLLSASHWKASRRRPIGLGNHGQASTGKAELFQSDSGRAGSLDEGDPSQLESEIRFVRRVC